MSAAAASTGAARTQLLAGAALLGFAANSLLCRLALAGGHADAASFTAVRLASGAAVLVLLVLPRGGLARARAGSFGSAALLFLYAAPFSYAYLRLGAGMGALVLFGAVQATMLGAELARGTRLAARTWTGLVFALGGLAALTLPGASAPEPLGVGLMALAGIAWGAYSLRGRASGADPLAVTAGNFARALPLALVLFALAWSADTVRADGRGLLLAVASGALASGLGYSLWYAALRHLERSQAALLQLVVPVLAAVGGVLLLDERLSLRLVLCGAAILGGVALALRPARA